MKNNDYEGSERRTYFRIFYKPSQGPTLIVEKREFEIADISEGGIRLIGDQQIELEKLVRGKITFLCGESMEVEGNIMWEQNNQVGILLKDYIPPAIMEKEQHAVILASLKNDI